MLLITDQQTLNDLSIFGRRGSDAIFNIYNRTHTRGGAALLEELFRHPLSEASSINRRSSIIRHFMQQGISFSFDTALLDAAEQYLGERDERTRLSAREQSLGQKLSGLLASDTEYKNIVKGITALTVLLQELLAFVNSAAVTSCLDYEDERKAVMALLSETAFGELLKAPPGSKLSQEQLAAYDSILRFRLYEETRKLLQYIYSQDVYISLAQVTTERGYTFASARDDRDALLVLEDVKHPAVSGAKGNNIVIDGKSNVVFLTGANMAGKSTFMKSVGIAMYIAHTGLPVAAKKMEFSVLDGFFSTINLPDNLGMGASHFYAEVLRVKKVAVELNAGKKLFVLFDELFRGTNVKDANEATIAVVKGFANKVNSMFIISTHIIEAGEVLKTKSSHIQYRYLPTRMEGNKPVYTYKLEEGITGDRHGMVIIRNEGILEMLRRNKPK
jgi:DNA mismatch repair protein MutS